MRRKPLKINKFLGINNVQNPESVAEGEMQTISNADVTNSATIKRRTGFSSVYSGACHSMFSDGTTALFREGGDLKLFNPASGGTVVRSGFSNRKMYYVSVGDRIYYSDGELTGVIQEGASRTWGLEVPSAPLLTETVGELPEGRYQIALVYGRDDGQESGALLSQAIDITQGGIIISSIPTPTDPTIDKVIIYSTSPSGMVLYKNIVVPVGTTTVTWNDTLMRMGVPIMTHHMTAPIAGTLLTTYNGRIFMAIGSLVAYTVAYGYELMDRRNNFKLFASDIKMIAPVDDGIWYSTNDETFFMKGEDPESGMVITRSVPYPAIQGTAVKVAENVLGVEPGLFRGEVWVWATSKGFCIGGNDGIFINVTDGKYVLPESVSGSATVRAVGDVDQYVVSLFE